MEALRHLDGYWVLIQWVNDHPPITLHGPYQEHAEAYYQARYYRQSGLWHETVETAYVVGNGHPKVKQPEEPWTEQEKTGATTSPASF